MGTPEPFPSELNTSTCSLAFLEVGKDKLSLRYTGPAQHDNDVGSIQSNHPVPRRTLVGYFEVTVKEARGGSVSLGFSDSSFKQGRHPGYEPHSYGYRGDTGRKHHSSLNARGEDYGPAFGPGDVVGAGIHLTKHEIFFTKNGEHLGAAFRNVTGHPLFPTIGLHSEGAHVAVNFGRQPFQYDVAGLVAAERLQMDKALEGTRVSTGEVHQLVRSYLQHYGYADSLAAFNAAAGMPESGSTGTAAAASCGGSGGTPPPTAQHPPHPQQQAEGGSDGTPAAAAGEAAAAASLTLRSRLRQLLMAAAAAEGGGGSSGGGASPSPSSSFELRFHLCCQQYVELIRAGDIAAALAYAGGPLSELRGASLEHDARLADSPLAGLLSPAQREATADVVNAAVLRSHAPPGSPEPQAALEVLLQQLTAVQNELHELAGGDGPEFDLRKHLPPEAAEQHPDRNDAADTAAAQEAVPMAEGEHKAAHSPGVLILEEPVASLPGRILDYVQGPLHYLDLGGVQERSLAAFGGAPELLAGITKLYASHSGLASVDGLQRLPAVRWLYLDHNQLPESELLRLPEVLPAGLKLEALDVSGNPGCTAEVERRLLASSLLTVADFFNGRRLSSR
ncbi:Ran-binding protein M [Chlorella vulgaris]